MRAPVMMRVGASDHPLSPTYGAMREIEGLCDAAVAQLYLAHQMQALKIGELAIIVTAGMNAARPSSADADDVAAHLFDTGVSTDAVRRPIAAYLLELGWSPSEAREKLAAEWGDAGESADAAA